MVVCALVCFKQLACKWAENDKKETHQPETHEGHFGALIRYVRFLGCPSQSCVQDHGCKINIYANKNENLIRMKI